MFAISEERIIKTNISGNKGNEILRSVVGQMSDGIWEDSSYYTGYWLFVDIDDYNNICVYDKKYYSHDTYYGKPVRNKFYSMPDDEVKKFFARMIKKIVFEELKDRNINRRKQFKLGNSLELSYMNYRECVTVSDCVEAYNTLMDE